jgi:Fe-S oxidoreductase
MHTVETPSRDSIGKPLRQSLGDISEQCIRCDLCQKECAFLRKYGKPKDIAESYDPTDKRHLGMPFECSLCQLCAAVCPVKINPADMFLEMRRETVSRGAGEYAEHAVILGYEGRGTSRKYTYYTLPKGCDTVFFPGCTLPGTRPDKVIKVYEHLRQHIPSIGMVLDCCTKPSHDLGREAYMTAMFGEMKLYLQEAGVKTVLVACPNCYKVFSRYGAPLSVRTVYEVLAEHGLPVASRVDGTVTVHDPCAVRFEEGIHAAVRNLIADSGLTVEEMPHTRTMTLCCGEGGAVGFLSPELAGNWGKLRRNEVNGKRTITYCAG